MKISVIIPVLDEGEHLDSLLPELFKRAETTSLLEIIVVDGGSRDGSPEIARMPGCWRPRKEGPAK